MKKFFAVFLSIVCLASVTACGAKNEPLSFHSEKQEAYLNDAYKNYTLYANGTEELSKPEPIVLSFKGNGSDTYTVLVSEYEDMRDAKAYPATSEQVSIYNLKANTTYYYQAQNESFAGKVKSFSTDSKAPRNLFIDGVTNARDLGGWKISENTYVKQNMILRTSKFNFDESSELKITESGIETLVNDFAIKTEIDLRTVADNENGGITESPLGKNVRYISMPFESGGNVILLNKDKLPDLFAIFGDEANYPIVFHCSIGTDRTGMVAFLINGLLGVDKEDLYRDFLFSNFGEIGSMRTPSIIKTYMETVGMAAGNDLSEQIYNYLIGAGVAGEDLDNLKAMMIETR